MLGGAQLQLFCQFLNLNLANQQVALSFSLRFLENPNFSVGIISAIEKQSLISTTSIFCGEIPAFSYALFAAMVTAERVVTIAAKRAYEKAGISPQNIDVAEIPAFSYALF